jgi:2-iminobutanoate/2-iminopropanoate deaminase
VAISISNPPKVAASDGHFSQAVEVTAGNRLLFISGQVPRDVNGATVGKGDMTAQADQVFANLRDILAAHGSGFDRAIKATIFVSDVALVPQLMAVRQRYYGAAKPASTLVAVSALGHPHWLLEVELIAEVPNR